MNTRHDCGSTEYANEECNGRLPGGPWYTAAHAHMRKAGRTFCPPQMQNSQQHTHTQDERIHFSSHTGSDSNMRMQCREARRSKQTRQQPHQASPLPQSKEYVREEEIDFTYMIVWLDTKRKKCWFDGRNSDANMNRGFSPGGLGTWTNPLKQNLRIRQQPALIFFSPKRDRKERVRKRETQNTCSSLYCIDAG